MRTIMDYCRISDALSCGGQPTEAQLKSMKENGVEAVINLRPATDALPGEQALLADQGIGYVNIPVDWEAPGLEDLHAFFTAMRDFRGRRVFVHCARNMRASVFLYLYRVLEAGVPEQEALDDLYSVWTPNELWQNLIDTAMASRG